MTQSPVTRLLAIDLKSHLLGVAVFEPPARLLDWGKRAMPADKCSAVVAQILRKYAASLVVVRGLKRGERRDTVPLRQGLHSLRMAARKYSTPVVALSERRVRRFFRGYKRCTRFEIARFLTVIFPDLISVLPGPRKCYEPEDRRMAFFDAVALGLAFLGSAGDGEFVRTLMASAAGVFSAASR